MIALLADQLCDFLGSLLIACLSFIITNAMRVRLFFILPLLGIFLCSGVVRAQSSITNNSGTSGLYSVSSSSYYQNPSSEQQRTYNVGQAASSLVLQNENSTVTIDPTSAPAYSPQIKQSNRHLYLAWLSVGLALLGLAILVFGYFQKRRTAQTLVEPEPVKTVTNKLAKESKPSPNKTTDKASKKRKKKPKKKKRAHR